jgi:hypothetical protein
MKSSIRHSPGELMYKRNPESSCRAFAVGSLAVICLIVAVFCRAADTDKPAWRYVVPEAGDAMEHAPLKALSLAEAKPADLKESAAYRGAKRLYGEFRFGSPNSKFVAVVLDRISEKETDIYVDANRDREIDKSERLLGQGPKYRLPVNVEIVKGTQIERHPRTIVFRLGRAGQSLSYATAGYIEGTVHLGDREIAVRRMDANGDGGMADPVDLLWINLRGDGQWNPFTDRLPVSPILKLGDERYAVSTDWAGERFALKILEGTGTLELAMAEMKNRDALVELEVMLAGREGSVVRLDLEKPSASVPVGEYSIFQMNLTLKDPAGGEPWIYNFGGADDANSAHWFKVTKGNQTALNPLTGIKLKGTLDKLEANCRPDEEISIQPRVETGDNLPLTAVYRGKPDSSTRHPGADVSLQSSDGKNLSTTQSGFS